MDPWKWRQDTFGHTDLDGQSQRTIDTTPRTHRHVHSIPQAQARGHKAQTQPGLLRLARLARPLLLALSPSRPCPGFSAELPPAHQESLPPTDTGVHTQNPCIQTHDTSFHFWRHGGLEAAPPTLEAKGPPVPGAVPPWAEAVAHEAQGEARP